MKILFVRTGIILMFVAFQSAHATRTVTIRHSDGKTNQGKLSKDGTYIEYVDHRTGKEVKRNLSASGVLDPQSRPKATGASAATVPGPKAGTVAAPRSRYGGRDVYGLGSGPGTKSE